MKFKAILFDVYGTLISTGTGSLDAARAILARNGRADISPEAFYARWKALHRAHIDRLAHFRPEAEIFRMDLQALYEEYGLTGHADKDVHIMLDTLGHRQAFPETAAVLETLSGRFLLAIASTTDTAPLLADLERNNLHIAHNSKHTQKSAKPNFELGGAAIAVPPSSKESGFFGSVLTIYTSERLMAYKPRPEFYRKILADLDVPAGEALFVGDSLTDDVAGPQEIGMKACWVNRKAQMAVGITPDYIVPDLTGLLDILQAGESNGKE